MVGDETDPKMWLLTTTTATAGTTTSSTRSTNLSSKIQLDGKNNDKVPRKASSPRQNKSQRFAQSCRFLLKKEQSPTQTLVNKWSPSSHSVKSGRSFVFKNDGDEDEDTPFVLVAPAESHSNQEGEKVFTPSSNRSKPVQLYY